MEINGETYLVTCDPATGVIVFQGVLRLRGEPEYRPIKQLLDDVATSTPGVITLDLRALRFLNSAGINMLLEFTIQVRDQGASQMVIRGLAETPWQERSLGNLKRLMPGLQLELT